MVKWILLVGLAAVVGGCAAVRETGAEARKGGIMWAYIGTWPSRESKGIYVCRWDGGTGTLGEAELATEAARSTYVAPSPDGRVLYAVDQERDAAGKERGLVRAFAIDAATGKLTLMNTVESGGAGPCYVACDRAGRYVLVANYNSGSVEVIALKKDGSLGEVTGWDQHVGSGPDKKRQTGPHAHCFDFDPSERFALSCDLGTDETVVYRFEEGKIERVGAGKNTPGTGPRHVAFSADGTRAYVVSEMGCTMTVFERDVKSGEMKAVQELSTERPGYVGQKWAAEVVVSPDGKNVYATNRGDESIVRYAVERDGKLRVEDWTDSGGKTPRYAGLVSGGRYMLVGNQDGGNVVVFRVGEGGKLEKTGEVKVPGAICVKVVGEGQ